MRPETHRIVRAAWAEMLGVDAALLETGERLTMARAGADTISFVRLFGQGILVGPQWGIDRASNLSDHELSRLAVLGRLASGHGGRPLGAATLSYTDTRVEHAELPMTQDAAALEALEAACSPEDVDEVGLGGMPHRWVLLEAPAGGGAGSADASSHQSTPLAGTGYAVWAGRLAHMGVLTSPRERGRGYGVLAAAAGTNAALEAGLIPQWRARWDNEASQRVAQALGYELAGSQTTVFIDPE